MINFSIYNQSAADTAAKRYVTYRIEPDACAVQRFAECPRVRVVIHAHRQAAERLQPTTEFEIGPAFNLVRAANLACLPIHGTAEADANGGRFFSGYQFSKCCPDLLADAGAAFGAVHREVPPFNDFCGIITDDELEFCPADFDAQVMFSHWSSVGQDSVKP